MQHVRHVMHALTGELLRVLPPADRVMAAWPYACGTAVAARARAESFTDSTLHVTVQGREWTELSGLRGAYVAKLKQLTGVEVNDISFRVEGTKR